MAATPQFDPFHNRQCRDIRNALSESFIAAVHQKSLAPVSDHVEVFKSKTVAPFMARYMDDRLKRYQAVIQTMLSRRIPLTDVYRIACQMWNQSLFFEFHEWLEESWHLAQGDEKRMLQTLIRSAGAYLLHTAGRANGAQKLASKAVAGLKELRSRIPDGFDVERLIKKLADLDSPPPRFGC